MQSMYANHLLRAFFLEWFCFLAGLFLAILFPIAFASLLPFSSWTVNKRYVIIQQILDKPLHYTLFWFEIIQTNANGIWNNGILLIISIPLAFFTATKKKCSLWFWKITFLGALGYSILLPKQNPPAWMVLPGRITMPLLGLYR